MSTQLVEIQESDCQWITQPLLEEVLYKEALIICEPLIINRSISTLLVSIVLESLSLRQEEWRSRGIDPNQVGVSTIDTALRPGLTALLTWAREKAAIEGREYIMLMDILEAITARWCRIFPFCRERTWPQMDRKA